MGAVRAYYEKMGDKFVNALNEMLVFDAVICNVDRHFGNFGVMVFGSGKNSHYGPGKISQM